MKVLAFAVLLQSFQLPLHNITEAKTAAPPAARGSGRAPLAEVAIDICADRAALECALRARLVIPPYRTLLQPMPSRRHALG